MSTQTLTTIFIVLLSINFVIWIAFAIFLFVQVRKVFKTVQALLSDVTHFSNSVMGSALKIAPFVFALLKGFQQTRSINTLSDIWKSDSQEEEKNGKKKK